MRIKKTFIRGREDGHAASSTTSNHRVKAQTVLDKMEIDVKGNVANWKGILQNGAKEMYKEICGPREVEVPVEE